MAESSNNQQLQEWGPLTDLLQKLPRKVHSGILSQEVKITCIDVVPEFIALGTSTGLVCWYNRAKRDLQKLQCENPNSQISSIKVISTVDYMLACGTSSGTINIFQIPKVHPESIPENLKPKKQQVERYLVSDMHKQSISALEWSKNGMKLFSGDMEGVVVLTELDFYMHICKSVEILNESYKVVQLSYYHHNLLISTTYRSIVCRKLEKWKITQVGKKGRKIFGDYGGIIYSDSLRPNNCVVYCTRPGLRIWISDMEGNVQKTILFKDALKKQNIYMTNMGSSVMTNFEDELAFSTIATFQANLLVTYCNKLLYVLDPQKMGVVHKYYSARGILDVATTKEEIFILEENKNLVRLSYGPESVNQETRFGLPVNIFPASMNILGLTLDGCSIAPGTCDGLTEVNNLTITNTEEAIECTGEENCFDDTDTNKQNRNNAQTITNTYSKISQEDYDDNIIYKHHRYSKSHSRNGISENGHHGTYHASHNILNASSMPIAPDLRSPESIKSDIETKEKLISEILNFDKVKINVTRLDRKQDITAVNKNSFPGEVSLTNHICDEKLNFIDERGVNTLEKSDIFTNNSFIQFLEDECETDRSTSKLDTAAGVSNNDMSKSSSYNGDNATLKIAIDIPLTKHNNEVIPSIPEVVTIPSEWNLSSVELKQHENAITESDNSLNDWEII